LEGGSYLELDPATGCKHYDERGLLLGDVKPQGEMPILAAGQNRVKFACEGPPGLATRAEVTLISYGPPLPDGKNEKN
jgi:hypothetical protein